MRTLWLSCFVLLATACSSASTSDGGGVSLSLGDAGATAGGVFTTTPAGAAKIQGEFSASGDFEGEYTLTTSIPSGSPLATCLVSVDDGTPSASVQVDAATNQTHTLTVAIGVGAQYQGQAVCDVTATNNAKPNVGDAVTIQVVQSAGDAG